MKTKLHFLLVFTILFIYISNVRAQSTDVQVITNF